MRCAKLKKEWMLRGWTDEPWTLLNWTNGDCRKLSEALFHTACACDGQSDFDHIAGFLQKNSLLEKLLKAGMAEECRQGEEIADYQRFRRAANPYIRHVHWAITGRCNLKCRHCYMESPDNRYGELPLPDMLRIMDQLAAANVHSVSLTGGEPFLRTDLLTLMEALAQRQIAVSQIYSNGVLITEPALQGIKQLGFLPGVQISFDGDGFHDAMRGVTGAEGAAVKALELLQKHGFPVTVSTSIDRVNLQALAATYERMKEWRIQCWRVAPPVESGNWRQNTTGLAGDEMLSACAAVTARWAEDGRPFLLQIPGFRSPVSEADTAPEPYGPESYDCEACRVSCLLMPDGKVLPCPGYADTVLYDDMPNLREESFDKIWSDSLVRRIANIRKKEILQHSRPCVTCEGFAQCGGGCRAMAVSATGDLFAAHPQSCELYKSRYQQRFDEYIQKV